MHREPPRILIYTQDSLGLGHLRRATNLANELVERRADLSVLLVVDSPVAPFFQLKSGIDFMKLPTVIKVGAGVFRPGRLQTDYERVKTLRSGLLCETVLGFAPHVMLVDHMPGGANRELVPALEAIRSRSLPTRMVIGLRDIIDDPSVTRTQWQREGVYRMLRRHYDRVLIYGSPDVFATAEEYRIDGALGERVSYCGYVCNMSAVPSANVMRARLHVSDERVVVVVGGGGADSFRLMRTYLDAAQLLAPQVSIASVLVPGPFLPSNERKFLNARARSLRAHTSEGDALGRINAADVVVSMAGYNTLSEILRFGKRAIVVPRPGPSAEQRMRAELFAQRGLVDALEPSTLEPGGLAQSLTRALDSSTAPARRVPALDGLARASEALLEELDTALSSGRRTRASAGHAAGAPVGA